MVRVLRGKAVGKAITFDKGKYEKLTTFGYRLTDSSSQKRHNALTKAIMSRHNDGLEVHRARAFR